MGFISNRIEKKSLKPGDHIYSWRKGGFYSHHGIYIGEGDRVIHFTAHKKEIGSGSFSVSSSASSSLARSQVPCPNCPPSAEGSNVLSSCLDCFLAGGKLYRFEYGVNRAHFMTRVLGGTCTLAVSDPDVLVVYRAKYLLEKGFGCYNLFTNNCEDFAIYCKTGLIAKDRVTCGQCIGAMAGLGNPLTGTAVGASSFWVLGPIGGGIGGIVCAVTTGMNCAGRYYADMGVRKDVVNILVEALTRIEATGFNSSY